MPSGSLLRFDRYEFDPGAGDLRLDGRSIHVQDKPLRLLEVLLARPSRLVTRAELRQLLWPEQQFGDFEDGLNTVVRKLREALADDAEQPRFIATVPRRGYRWIAPVEAVAPTVAPAIGNEPAAVAGPKWPWRWVLPPAAALILFAVWWLTPLPPPQLTNITPITRSGHLDYLTKLATDGDRLFYLERAGDHWQAMQTTFRGGSGPARVLAGFPQADANGRNVRVFDVSPDGTRLLVGAFTQRGENMRLWTMSATGGAAMPVGNVVSGEAVWHADGRHIVYTAGNWLMIAAADGSGARAWVRVPGVVQWLAWSPDGQRLGFSVTAINRNESGIWEIDKSGGSLHRLLPDWAETPCCGVWTPDGRYFIFVGGDGALWARRERGGWRRAPRGPFQLTFGPKRFTGVVVGGRPARAAFYGPVGSEELNLWNAAKQRATVFLPGLRASMFAASRDGSWVAFVRDETLWRARTDGSEARQLTLPGLLIGFPRIAPNGDRVAFPAARPGELSRLYTLAANGGAPEEIPSGGLDAHDPDWSPDGQHIVFVEAATPTDATDQTEALYTLTLRTGHIAQLPDSQGLAVPRWANDGRSLAALRWDQRAMIIYDINRRRPKIIARGNAFGIPAWSHDGQYLYFQDLLAPGEPLFRWAARTGQITRVAEFSSVLRSGIDRCGFMGLTADDKPVISFNRGSNDLFAGDLRLP